VSTTIKLNHITKIEGHASLAVKIEKGKITKCELSSTEGARFFEGLVVGKPFSEVQEITSRICGICSCSHTIAALQAVENAIGVRVSHQTEMLRELLMVGERIRSHASHLYFLALPDYYGYESAIDMARDNKRLVDSALEIIRLGNNIVSAAGGREIHPITAVVGGFTHVPSKEECAELSARLKKSRGFVKKTARLFLELDYPDFEKKTEYVSLKQGFPLMDGVLVSTQGLHTSPKNYLKFFKEYIEEHSTAKFAVKDGKSYVGSALARINNNYNSLSVTSRNLIEKSSLRFPSYNPFHNNAAQGIEILHWVERAIKILGHKFTFEGLRSIKPRDGRGVSCVEAPRGLLFHDYSIRKGLVEKCSIITPTCQNLRNIQEDIKAYLPHILDMKKEQIVLEIEKLIRAYDPCFSCATHFLKVDWG